MDIKNLSVPERAAALRRVILARYAVAAREVFEAHSKVRSIAFCVAQFWADDADDEVHFRLCPSELETPNFAAVSHLQYVAHDSVNFPRSTKRPADYRYGAHDPLGVYGVGPYISAFATYCEETSQDADFDQAYSAFAIFRRQEDKTISTEIVGKPLRPWLDAVDNNDEEYDSFAELAAEAHALGQATVFVVSLEDTTDRLVNTLRAWAPSASASDILKMLNEVQRLNADHHQKLVEKGEA